MPEGNFQAVSESSRLCLKLMFHLGPRRRKTVYCGVWRNDHRSSSITVGFLGRCTRIAQNCGEWKSRMRPITSSGWSLTMYDNIRCRSVVSYVGNTMEVVHDSVPNRRNGPTMVHIHPVSTRNRVAHVRKWWVAVCGSRLRPCFLTTLSLGAKRFIVLHVYIRVHMMSEEAISYRWK